MAAQVRQETQATSKSLAERAKERMEELRSEVADIEGKIASQREYLHQLEERRLLLIGEYRGLKKLLEETGGENEAVHLPQGATAGQA